MIRAWVVPQCDSWLNLELTKPKYNDLATQIELDHDTYIIYKGLLLQFDKLQEKLHTLREQKR